MDKVYELAAAMQRAEEAINAIENREDGGTCNFDQPVLDLSGYSPEEVRKLEESALISRKMSGKFWKDCYRLNLSLPGQGALRTRAAELAHKVLTDAGFNSRMYYQID